jgi:hypothetical protein
VRVSGWVLSDAATPAVLRARAVAAWRAGVVAQATPGDGAARTRACFAWRRGGPIGKLAVVRRSGGLKSHSTAFNQSLQQTGGRSKSAPAYGLGTKSLTLRPPVAELYRCGPGDERSRQLAGGGGALAVVS